MSCRFEIKDDFYLDGERIKIISGSINYFRIVHEYWSDLLEKLKMLGANTVETYIPWNFHEKEKGKFDFSGKRDIAGFVKIAQELGLWVILRPAPYICAEWEFGGLPYWLLAEDGMRLRCNYGPYLKHVREYYGKLFEVIAPLQITDGGPVIMMQVENEYGSYGNDWGYTEYLKNLMIECGCRVPLVTSDGPTKDMLDCGEVKDVLQTGNFGSRGREQLSIVKKKVGDKPLMCMEFWVGWFDSWGAPEHMGGDTAEHAKDLDEILSMGSVNIYMFIGGTNFGFLNGSNYYDMLTPDVTSYDYDALLTEDGQFTPKYEAFKKVISNYVQIPEVKLSTEIKRKAYGTLKAERSTGLFPNLGNLAKPIENLVPQSMEKVGQGYGYILYENDLAHTSDIISIRLTDANDRASIFVDEKPAVTLYDRELLEEHVFVDMVSGGEAGAGAIFGGGAEGDSGEEEHEMHGAATDKVPDTITGAIPAGKKLSILVENMGRVNYGCRMEKQRKGIDGNVVVNRHQLYYWKQYCLPMEDLSGLDFSQPLAEGTPGFYEFSFEVQELGDTFLDFEGWGKGCVLLNGFNIGRFWEIGPQRRLYIPAPLLKEGKNTILIFETEGKASGEIRLLDEPHLG